MTGLDHLNAWLADHPTWTQPKLAGAVDVSQTTVSRWLSEESAPEHPQRAALAALTGKPIDRVPWNEREADRTREVVQSARDARPRARRVAGA